jgi:hypothetical protein
MLELLAEIVAYCVKLFRAELPNCALVLEEIRSGKRSLIVSARAYVLLCQLTSVALVFRLIGGLSIPVVAGIFAVHLKFAWPPFDFNDSHMAHFAFSIFTYSPPIRHFHYCEALFALSMCVFIAASLFYAGLAWSSRLLVRESFPLSKTEAITPSPLSLGAHA